MSTIEVYQPQYFKRFRCTGSECKNNCCHHWQIHIDKDTYDKYMSLDDDTKKEFNEKLKLVNKDNVYAHIVLDSDQYCTFLDKRGLCTIQLRFGHDYLSNTCKYYPRIICVVDGCPEYFLELSCEAAAKIILFNTPGKEF